MEYRIRQAIKKMNTKALDALNGRLDEMISGIGELSGSDPMYSWFACFG